MFTIQNGTKNPPPPLPHQLSSLGKDQDYITLFLPDLAQQSITIYTPVSERQEGTQMYNKTGWRE